MTTSDNTGPGGPIIHVATRCTSVDEFVERFAGLAAEEALVLPAARELPIGTEGRFIIHLADRSVAMRGRCRVTDVRPSTARAAGAAPRMMLRVALIEMDEESRAVHDRLLALQRAPVPPRSELPIGPPRIPQVGGTPGGTPGGAPGEAPGGVPRARVMTPPITSRHRPPPPPPVSPAVARTLIGSPAMMSPKRPSGPQAPVGPAAPLPPASDAPVRFSAPERAPGARDTLPVNPLSTTEIEDLSSMVEETLAESGPTTLGADAGEPPLDGRASGAPAFASDPGGLPADVLAAPAGIGLDVPDADDARRPAWPSKLRQLAPIVAGAITVLGIGGLLVARSIRQDVAPAAPAGTPVTTAAESTAERAPPAPTLAPVVVERPSTIPAPPPETATAPAPTAPPGNERRPAVPAGAERPPAAAPAAAGTCVARIVTEPRDARVFWDGRLVGRSPIERVEVPCGAGRVAFDRDRYEPLNRDVVSAPGETTVISEKLRRPPATLTVTSSPPGAEISINGRAFGTTPRAIEVMRYERLAVRIALPDRPAWTKSIYVKEARMALDASLEGGPPR